MQSKISKNIWSSPKKMGLRDNRLIARKVHQNLGDSLFKTQTSAKWTDITKHLNGALRVQIQHEDSKGVTPKMIKWWFENLAQKTTWNGKNFSGPEVSFYHLWHHRDHIAVQPLSNPKEGKNNGFAVGAYSKIQEQFNDFNEIINNKMLTITLDETEFTFLIKFGFLTVGRINHYYEPSENGSTFYAETYIGVDIPVLGWIINWCFLPFVFSKKTAEHWIKHNIEETGQTEKIVPFLYNHYNKE